MFFSRHSAFLHLMLVAVVMQSGLHSVVGGPICPAPTLSLTEQTERADVVLQAVWKESREGSDEDPGVTVYEISRIVKAPEGLLSVGDKLEIPEFRAGTQGNKFLLTGTKDATIEWGIPQDGTDAALQYIEDLPSPSLNSEQRLPYFLKYLEHENELIASDAYSECASVLYEDILKVRKKIPMQKVRQWIANPHTVSARLHLYGLMLGLSGDRDDAASLLTIINKPTQDFRPELDGIMSGYLMLAGSEGLKILEIFKLKNREVPFAETYAAMQALRFLWNHEPDRIPKARLRQSMRTLLDRPILADLVIADLRRWEDWEVIDRLLVMCDEEAYNQPSIKRAIVLYLLAYQEANDQTPDEPSAHAVKAATALERIQKEDPKLYRQALRFAQFQ